MAGLPKTAFVLLSALGIALAVVLTGFAQGIQTGSVVLPPGDVQTGSNVLQPVFDLIDENTNADPADQENLKASIENAVTLGFLTPEEALAMLDLVEWGTLAEADALANASSAIQAILADLVSGTLTDGALAELARLLDVLATPAGTLNAIGKAGASDELLDQVASLVASGVPPGIVVRITKEGLRTELDMGDIAAQLDALAAAVIEGEDVAWGQVANNATGKNENKQPSQEQSESVVGSDDSAPGNNGKKDDNPGQGKGKDKDKDKDK